MNKLLTFLLTKTGLARTLAAWVCSFFIAWGIIDEDKAKNVWVPEVALVIVALAGRFLEKKKDEGTKVIQDVVGAKPDGWAGPRTAAAVKDIDLASRPAAADSFRHKVHIARRSGGFFKG